jgi:hypothetical protein
VVLGSVELVEQINSQQREAQTFVVVVVVVHRPTVVVQAAQASWFCGTPFLDLINRIWMLLVTWVSVQQTT